MISAPGLVPAGVVTRALAATADAAMVGLLTVALYVVVAGARFVWAPWAFTWPRPTTWLSIMAAGLIATAYLTAAWAIAGRTVGAGLMGVRVLSRTGRALGWTRALVRALTCVLFPVGLLWSAISPTRRSVQDLVVGSVVAYDGDTDGRGT